jgi:phosphate acyltransferase
LMTKSMAALLKPRLKKFAQAMDYKEHGGAPLLGLKGPVIKAHGSSDARAFCNAIRQTRRFLQHDVISRMEEELS